MSEDAIDINSEAWLPVDKNYLKILRIGFSLVHVVGVTAALFFMWLLPKPVHFVPMLAVAVLVSSFLWLFFVWAPRCCRRMRYLLREQDINLQRGFMFWHMVSVSINRIQHLEVRQGPVERHYGLATLIIYTAGTQGSDLKVPGLTLAKAQQLKSQLLNNINAEAADVDEPL
jgi:membrane protein YdbS with pleckstrin-like domain